MICYDFCENGNVCQVKCGDFSLGENERFSSDAFQVFIRERETSLFILHLNKCLFNAC